MTLTKPKKRKQKTLGQLKRQAWCLLSQVIRTEACRHTGVCNCYTCGAPLEFKTAQAGHAIPGRHNVVLFDEEIIRIQGICCNIFKGGNYPVFITKLIEENGFAWWQEKLAASRMTIKYDRAMLEFKIDSYRERLGAMGQ
jgi:hypothetical protein